MKTRVNCSVVLVAWVLAALAPLAANAALPEGYTELDYIYMEGGAANQSSATHYIDTGVVPSGDWTISASFASTNTTGASGSAATLSRTAASSAVLFSPSFPPNENSPPCTTITRSAGSCAVASVDCDA